MQSQITQQDKSNVVVAHGYSLKVRVENRHLLVEDGFGRQRRTRRFHRTSKLRRLVVIGRSGYVSFDSLIWLRDTGAAFVHVDANGELIAASVASGPDFPALRRAQAVAVDSPAGLEIARHVLRSKVVGQRELLPELPGGADAVEPVGSALEDIDSASDLPTLLAAEALAAERYWRAWAKLPIPFPARETARLPEHWLLVQKRASLITGGPRLATNPAGALLNYCYALLEAESILACHAVGLDPGIGIFHTDRRDRASLALDLGEAARPAVDSYVLALLTQRMLSPRDFVETREGACRIAPRFAAQLTETCALWRQHIAPIVELAAHTLAQHSPARLPLLTPLTRGNWKRAWDERAPDRRQRSSRAHFAKLPSTCRDCGVLLADQRRRYCEQCRKLRWTRQASQGRQNAAAVLAQLRAEQRDPAHGGRAAESRGRKNAAHQAAVREWRGERPDPEVFRSEILPGLRQHRSRG